MEIDAGYWTQTVPDTEVSWHQLLLSGRPVMPCHYPLKRPPKQPDRQTAAKAESHKHQEEGFVRHPLPERAEKPGEIIAEEAE